MFTDEETEALGSGTGPRGRPASVAERAPHPPLAWALAAPGAQSVVPAPLLSSPGDRDVESLWLTARQGLGGISCPASGGTRYPLSRFILTTTCQDAHRFSPVN